MKKLLFLTIFIFIFSFVLPTLSFTQGMMGRSQNNGITENSSTTQDEAKGKEVFDRLQSKQVDCKSLTDDDFDILGDYFMGNMMGNSHESVNTMMTQMIGESGEKQMHIVMGKRLSGCDTQATVLSQGTGFMPMMGMMSMMMGGWGVFGLITWILVIIFLILGIAYFWKEINRRK